MPMQNYVTYLPFWSSEGTSYACMAGFNINNTTIVLEKRNFDIPSSFHLQTNEIRIRTCT